MTDRAPAAASSLAIAPSSVPAGGASRINLRHLAIAATILLTLGTGFIAGRASWQEQNDGCSAAYSKTDRAATTLVSVAHADRAALTNLLMSNLSGDQFTTHMMTTQRQTDAASADIKAAHALGCGH